MPAPDAIPKILVTGPESSGKTTLSKQLAKTLGGTYVREYVRDYFQELGREYVEGDLVDILRGQLRLERKAVEKGAKLLICDTGPEVIYIWSQEKYGRVDQEITRAVKAMDYELIMVCWPEFKWEPDPMREHPEFEDRRRLFDSYLKLLKGNSSTREMYHVLHPEFREEGLSQLDQALHLIRMIPGLGQT